MEYAVLPGTDLKVSRIAFGCMSTVSSQTYAGLEQDEGVRAIRTALDEGITFFDTARAYGDGASEELLGNALEGDRNRAVIATKPTQNTEEQLVAQCNESLRLLKTDYIDLYQIHWPKHDVPAEETVRALEDLKQSGKIRAIGVCNYGPIDLAEFTSLTTCATNQIAYSLLTRAAEFEVVEPCVDAGIGILCYSPLAQGLLADRFRTADEVPTGRARSRHFASTRPEARHDEAGCETETFAAIDAIREIAARKNASMAELSLAWLLKKPGVLSVLVGASRPDQVTRNVQAARLELSDADVRDLDAATDQVKQCMGRSLDVWATPSRIR